MYLLQEIFFQETKSYSFSCWILSDIEQFQDAQCDDMPSGSLSKSSQKRRGRPPAMLMEPRKEADRPVLTPNGAE